MALGEVIELKSVRKDIIEFKGTKNGISINIKQGYDFETIKNNLIERIEKSKNFFNGAKISSINSDELTDIEIIELKDIITTHLKLQWVENKEEEKDKVFEGIKEGNTKIIKTTLRSGSKVEYKGNVVIIGDINPGAQVVAYGNVIIMGSLRGVVHAGANGNKDAFVAAYNLDPMQLRIANLIAIAPEDQADKPNIPEIAYIKNNSIIIEPYLSKNGGGR
ncbi:septum site-determining protein MinC [Alkalithermobacter thermoalcaliphilus JW-YL-7 = DSM 7308]|uniref:Probable septum site-determining protein MinC n=1 Tax=Alkalithermobacter thermoalcaliphilus JW-YL-7 = DSM 7308 TaxID=1121328 RepID=A0A150FRE2_CLOPD|nr:septum site-determining protein minC [[Clostridium] paradoxum JW-YL-7 = DSM 7308]SHK44630.1 septum site-determining protein MinC [[Clostridium] paradoxum JW-YL-7 = DSM 7308]